MFVKLKASLSSRPRADDGGKETRRRHRLSKPLTNKSSTNPLILYTQQLDGQTNNSSDPDISPASLSTPSSQGNSGQVIQAPASESKPHILQTSAPIPGQEYWKSATFIVSKNPVEGVDSSMLLSPRSSLKAKRPLSAIVALSNSRKASNSAQRRASLQALAALAENEPDKAENARSATTVSCSPESQSEALSPRLHRRSSFTPGVATRTSRKPSWSPPPVGEHGDADRNHYHQPTPSEEPPRSQLEVFDFDEEWAPPAPPVARSETPLDLDYTHLGGLRLGSLQVVNGRASPAPSELSRHLTGTSTPNLKRDASSNYGDAEDGTLITLASLRQKSYRGRDQGPQDFTAAPRKPVAAPLRSQTDGLVLPKREKSGLHASSNRVEASSVWMPAPRMDPPVPQRASRPPDKASELAMAYMAELSASPYSGERSSSPAGSVLKSTSKATEFDDALFEDDDAADLSSSYEMDYQTPDTHPVSSDPVWVYEDAYRLSVKRSRNSSSRPSLQPSNSTGSSVKQDSGYGSNISLQSLKGQTDKASSEPETTVPNKEAAQPNAVDMEELRGRPGAGPGPKPPRPSILKRHSSIAPQVPDFSNLYPSTTSTTTLGTITSTSSVPSAAPVKHRKLQKKARPRSQPPPVRQIVIQGQHRDFSNGDVPPPPTEIVANLAIRSQQVPELDHTFSSMHHSREIESSPMSASIPTLVNFPQTDGRPNDLLTEVNQPAPPSHRASLIKWSKTERRNNITRPSGADGISEDHAMAIIRNFDTAGPSMGGSPYDVAGKTTKSVASQAQQSKTPNDSHTRYQNSSRPRAMMDDATAAELARLRSRTIVERDTEWKQRRSSFNDRGGIPGRNIRPMSTAGDAPPLPALPSHEKVRQREFQKVDSQRPYLETRSTEKYYPGQVSYDLYESLAPPPPSHSPRPRTIELEGDLPPPPPSHSPRPRSIDFPEDATAPPPPPSHSPRPRSIHSSQEVSMSRQRSYSLYPKSVKPQEEVADIWAAQASAWKSRRKSIGEMLRSRTLAPDEQGSTRPFATEEAVIDDPVYPEIPLRRPQKSFTTGPEEYGRSDMQFSSAHPEPTLYKPTGRPGPSGAPFVGKTVDLAHSRHSQGPGRTSSHLVFTEEPHMAQDQRPQPPPQFGRYSGGLDYGYEHGVGFGGSAGTRSASGAAKATRKGVPLSEGFGVELSDIPVIASIRRKPIG